jgi:hypothetical protein
MFDNHHGMTVLPDHLAEDLGQPLALFIRQPGGWLIQKQ